MKLASAWQQTYRYALTLVLSVASFAGVLSFAISAQANAQAVTQSYTSDSTLQAGMSVRLDDNDKNKVTPVTQRDASKAYGVVVPANQAPLSLSGSTDTQRYYVATTGTYDMLVSDQNGAIKKGDFLVASAIDGVAMHADGSQQFAIGQALDDFDGTKDIRGQTDVTDSKGAKHTVHFGVISASINVARNPLLKAQPTNLPEFLRRTSQAIADKQVSAMRVYLGAGIVLVTAAVALSILYTGIRTSITAIGRNPLAKRAIVRNLLQVVLTAFIILILGLFTVYLILKL